MNMNPIELCHDPLTGETWVDGINEATPPQIDEVSAAVRANVPDFRVPLADALMAEAADRRRFIEAMSGTGLSGSDAVKADRVKLACCEGNAAALRDVI